MTQAIQTEQALWRELAARGEVQGEPIARVRTPWAVRALMGAAGWLGALFFQMFFLGAVFVAVRENAGAIAVTGLAMIVLAHRPCGAERAEPHRSDGAGNFGASG